MKNLIRIKDLNKQQIIAILNKAKFFKKHHKSSALKNKIIATLFFEPSTRTRLSFETAVLKLGGQVIGFTNSKSTSLEKGESLEDTVRAVSQFADLIVMRHPEAGSVNKVSKVISKPIINAGDGPNEHPTQTLLDLFSIWETQKKLDGLNIAIVGDLKYGRVPHSLVRALAHFKNKIYLVSPSSLKMPRKYLHDINYQERSDLNKIIPDMDIIYMTRIQKERFKNQKEYNKIKGSYILKACDLKNAKRNLKILHALPRVNEIATDVDKTKHAYYFQSVANGVYVRMAILSMML